MVLHPLIALSDAIASPAPIYRLGTIAMHCDAECNEERGFSLVILIYNVSHLPIELAVMVVSTLERGDPYDLKITQQS